MEVLESGARRWGDTVPMHIGEVVLPSAFVEGSVATLIGDDPDGDHIARAAGSTMTAFAAYRRSKVIYRLNEHLASSILEARWPGIYPMEQFRLPHNGMVIEVPPAAMRILAERNGALLDLPSEAIATGLSTYLAWNQFICYYDLEMSHGQDAYSSPKLVLRIGRPIPEHDQVYGAGRLSLTELGTLDDAWDEFISSADLLWDSAQLPLPSNQPCKTSGVDDRQHLFRLLLNSILYIQGDDDVVAAIHPGAHPTKTSKNPTKARRFQDLATPQVFDVGIRFGATVEHWEIEKPSTGGEAAGKTVRSHLRAAHAHLYWTGPGSKVARVRYLPPIKVKGGYQDLEAPVVVVRDVK